MKIITFNISDAAWDLLVKIGNRAAEYRDTEFSTLEEFKQSDLYKDGIRSEEYFLNRNYGGTYYLIDELYKYNLVDIDINAWHQTYRLTEFGKETITKL